MVRQSKLTRVEVTSVLEDCLGFLSKGHGPRSVHPSLDVLLEWSLDSEHGVELACDLSTRLGIEIPDNENPLIEENLATKKKRARTFGEVVDYLLKLSET